MNTPPLAPAVVPSGFLPNEKTGLPTAPCGLAPAAGLPPKEKLGEVPPAAVVAATAAAAAAPKLKVGLAGVVDFTAAAAVVPNGTVCGAGGAGGACIVDTVVSAK